MPTGSFSDADLTTRAKIRAAAMRLFADDGFATSIRTIARHAGVSPALITHHFGTKQALRDAVDEFVIGQFQQRAAELDVSLEPSKLSRQMGDVWPSVIIEHPDIRRYVRRSLLEGTGASNTLFDEFLSMVTGGLEQLDGAGALRADADPMWRPYQLLFVILGPILFEPFIQARIDGDAFGPAVVERRSAANHDFVTRGLFTM